MFVGYSGGRDHQVWALGIPHQKKQNKRACICHCICVHSPVFQGRSERASKRQLRVSLEATTRCVCTCGGAAGREARGQQLSSSQFFFTRARLYVASLSETGVYISGVNGRPFYVS